MPLIVLVYLCVDVVFQFLSQVILNLKESKHCFGFFMYQCIFILTLMLKKLKHCKPSYYIDAKEIKTMFRYLKIFFCIDAKEIEAMFRFL